MQVLELVSILRCSRGFYHFAHFNIEDILTNVRASSFTWAMYINPVHAIGAIVREFRHSAVKLCLSDIPPINLPKEFR